MGELAFAAFAVFDHEFFAKARLVFATAALPGFDLGPSLGVDRNRLGVGIEIFV